MKKAVITGIGAITSAGIGWKMLWNSVIRGESGIGPVSLFPSQRYRTRIAGEVKNFDATLYLPEKLIDNSDRFTQFAIGATHLALDDSRLTLTPNRRDTGVILGCGMGGLSFFEQQSAIFAKKGPGFIRPTSVPRIMTNAAAAHIAALWKIRGPNLTISTACSSSNHAIGTALDMIRSGRAKVVLCGGTESLMSPITFAAFDTLRVMSLQNETPKQAYKPFDRNRDGFVMGEGAVIFVLEEQAHAHERGASIYAEVAGYGASNGTYKILTAEPDGLEASESMESALEDASLALQDIGYIHAHGTGTQSNDLSETLAIKKTFGVHAKKIPISSTKPITGHMLGAAGAMGVLISTLAIHMSVIPHTLNYETPDPACDLDYVPGQPRHVPLKATLSNAFAFGSNNATIVLRQEKL